MGHDYYSVLGITADANDEEVRQAYKKKVLTCHPDRGGSEEQFRAVQEAYQILSDPVHRQIHDDPFAGLFGTVFQGWVRSYRKKTPPRVIDLPLTLQEVYRGTCIKYRIFRRTLPFPQQPCPTCHGRGYMYTVLDMGFFRAKTTKMCTQCEGDGVLVQDTDFQMKEEVLTFCIDRGVREGQEVILYGKGDEAPQRQTGDVVFRISYKPHAVFHVEGVDLVWTVSILLEEFLLGFEKKTKHLDGTDVCVVLQKGHMLESFYQRMAGRGLTGDGDMRIQIVLDLPKTLPPEWVHGFENIFTKKINASDGEL